MHSQQLTRVTADVLRVFRALFVHDHRCLLNSLFGDLQVLAPLHSMLNWSMEGRACERFLLCQHLLSAASSPLLSDLCMCCVCVAYLCICRPGHPSMTSVTVQGCYAWLCHPGICGVQPGAQKCCKHYVLKDATGRPHWVVI